MEYEDFELQIGPQLDEGLLVRVRSPAGDGEALAQLPKFAGDLEQLAGTTRHLICEAAGLPSTPEEVGSELFRAVFTGQVSDLLQRSLSWAEAVGCGLRLRIRINLRDRTLASLLNWPWELLYRQDTEEFLALSRGTPIVRALDVPRPSAVRRYRPPLRILAVLARDPESPPLGLEEELKQLQESLTGDPEIQLETLDDPDMQTLRNILDQREIHILHYMGHGAFEPASGEGALLFGGPEGRMPVTGRHLAAKVKDLDALRLVVLNACETAVIAGEAAQGPFAGVASALVLSGLPAVVAMQSSIMDVHSAAFTAAFYRRLARGMSVEEAVTEGRQAIFSQEPESAAWAIPVLFLRAAGALFVPERQTAATEPGSPDASASLPYRSMAPPAGDFVLRRELELAVKALTRASVEESRGQVTVALTTALRGAGGFGKTALAQAICELEAVRNHFPAGILWVPIGQDFNEAKRLARVRDLLRWWTSGKEPSSYETLEAAASDLRERLAGQQVLLVLDDVWRAADVAPFAGVTTPAALLVTTRNTRALPPATHEVAVDALELPQAVELLGQGLSPLPARSTLERLAAVLGEWPILLKLVNAQLREEYRYGVSAAEAFRIVEETLGELGLTAFDREDEEARNLAVRRTVEASLQRLSPEDRQRYARLAVFPEDERIPLKVLQLLWAASEQEAGHVCRRFAEMSLLYRFDPANRWIQLHDVMRAYLLREHRTETKSFQGSLVDSYLGPGKISESDPEAERYFLARLPYHLKESARESELKDLLFSYSWLEKKLTEADVNAAMADYELLPGDDDATAVREALLLSRSVLTKDLSQLASHLHGRLLRSPSARISALLNGAMAGRHRPWLRPLSGTFQRPSGPLRTTFQAHQGEIHAIVQLDERRFATSGTDGEIHIWDFATEELILTIPGAFVPIRHLAAISPNQVLAGSDDGIIRLWDLDEEQVIRSFEGHNAPITALRRRREEFISGAEDGSLLRWNLASEEPLRAFQGHSARINGIDYLDSLTMVSVGKDRTLRVWNLPSGRQLNVLTLHPLHAADSLEVTASNEVLLGTWAGEIQTWKPRSRDTKPRRSLRYRSIGVPTLCMLGKELGVSPIVYNSGIQLWNPRTGVLGATVHVPGGDVTALARFGDGYLLCGTKGGQCSTWAIEMLGSQSAGSPPNSVYSVAALDAVTATSSSPSGFVNVWDIADGSLLRPLRGHAGGVSFVCALDSGLVASSSSADSTLRIWNPHTGELLSTIQSSQKPGAISSLGGNLVALASADPMAKDQTIQIWELAFGQKIIDLPVLPGGVGALHSADGRLLLIGTYLGLILCLDLNISQGANCKHFSLKGHEKGVVSLALIDRNRAASGSLDKTIRIWNLDSQEADQILKGHEGAVTGLAAISSQLLASASDDQTIKLWDLKSGVPVVNLRLDTGLSSLAATPDGRTLIAGDMAGTVHFLRVEGLAHYGTSD